VFNTDQGEYVGDLTEAAGIRVVVHNQRDMPFPEDDSIAVSPGTLTYIGASLVRLAASSKDSTQVSQIINLSINQQTLYSASSKACIQRQLSVICSAYFAFPTCSTVGI